MIYFIRHGETDYNKEVRFQGHLDIPLNETGISQANEALENSKAIQFDVIYHSPLLRAKETAEIINSFHNAKLISDDRLKEIFMGTLQGRKFSELSEEEQRLSFTNPEHFGGESHDEFCARIISFYNEISNTDKNILIVSHGGVYRALYKHINNLTDLQFSMKPLPNASLILIKE